MGLLSPLPRFAGITKQPPQSVWLRGSRSSSQLLPVNGLQLHFVSLAFDWLDSLYKHHSIVEHDWNKEEQWQPKYRIQPGLSSSSVASREEMRVLVWSFQWTGTWVYSLNISLIVISHSLITCVLRIIWCFPFYSVYTGCYRTAVAITPWSAVGCLGCRLQGRRWRRPETSCGETVLRLQDSSSPSPLPCNSEELFRWKRNVKIFLTGIWTNNGPK